MKMGEALSLRARQAQQLDDLRGRIRANALVQEGEEPSENPDQLLQEFADLSREHSALLERIAQTNANSDVGGRTLLSLLHERESLRRERNITEAAAVSGTPNARDSYRYMRSEIRTVSKVNVAALRRRAQEIDEVIRKIDVIIQDANWKIDLAEL